MKAMEHDCEEGGSPTTVVRILGRLKRRRGSEAVSRTQEKPNEMRSQWHLQNMDVGSTVQPMQFVEQSEEQACGDRLGKNEWDVVRRGRAGGPEPTRSVSH